MKYSLLILLFWFGCLATVAGQTGWPSVLSIRTDSTYFSLSPAQFQVLEDPSGKLTFEQAQRSSGFQTGTHYNPNRQAHTCWLRILVRNDQDKNLNLYYNNIAGDYADVYWLDTNRRWQHQRAGGLLPHNKLASRNGYESSERVFISLKPGQQTPIYQRSENVWWHMPPQHLYPQLMTEEGLWKAVFRYYLSNEGRFDFWLNGIVVGILLLAVGYNLLVYNSTKERVYLYFALCLLFYVLDRNRSNIQTVLFDEYPYEFQFIGSFFFLAFFIFFVQSIRRFVQPNGSLARINKAVTASLGLMALAYIAQIAFFWWNPFVALRLEISLEVLIRIVYGLSLWITYRMVRKKNTDAWFVFVAITPLALWWLFTVVDKTVGFFFQATLSKELPQSFEQAESICFAWMIIFFLAALINRYNLTRQQVIKQAVEKQQLEKERSRLIAEQNERLERQVRERTVELQQSLETLRTTQNQLIQKEKLASLGELTAGIAHEIQNPLNFVNNFSEVSIELVEELREEKVGNESEPVEEILDDLKENLQKINHHGKRASTIVSGMLQHSRAGNGKKTTTDLNALIDEYLRLAYQGMRAKNKTFTCQIETDLDGSLPVIPVISQEISRVLLNLFSNAFYATQEQKKKSSIAYQPTVWVQTRLIPGTSAQTHSAEIRIRDNGTGISDLVKAKIFQPFFTTKPTGEGTGLGLSLSYDIITKGHGGELTVESREGEGAEFIVRLPIK